MSALVLARLQNVSDKRQRRANSKSSTSRLHDGNKQPTSSSLSSTKLHGHQGLFPPVTNDVQGESKSFFYPLRFSVKFFPTAENFKPNFYTPIAYVNTFPYLGSLITEDGECTTEFRARLSRGQAIGASLQKIWKSHSIPISTKTRLMKESASVACSHVRL